METNKEFLTTKEVADILGVSDKTVRNLCSARKIKHQRLTERNIRFKREWVDEYLKAITFEPENKEEF